MITEKSWDDFRKTGLVLIVNQILHIFGWALVFEVDESGGPVKKCYPARVKFRGFGNTDTSEAYKKVTDYLKDNVDELKKECDAD